MTLPQAVAEALVVVVHSMTIVAAYRYGRASARADVEAVRRESKARLAELERVSNAELSELRRQVAAAMGLQIVGKSDGPKPS